MEKVLKTISQLVLLWAVIFCLFTWAVKEVISLEEKYIENQQLLIDYIETHTETKDGEPIILLIDKDRQV